MALALEARSRGAPRAGASGPLVGGAIVLAIALAAAFAPLIATHDPLAQDLLSLNQGPGAAHLLGTDHIGRDVFSRLVVGARTTLLVGIGGTLVAFLIGAALGLAALALGRVPEMIVFGFIDLVRAMPGILLALLLIVAIGAGTGPVTLALGISFAPFFAYIARASYKREAAQDYVKAAGLFGGGRLHVLALHILPNVMGGLVTQAAIILPRCIVTESVLSFLGLGSSPDAPTWGRMVSDASRYIELAPHAILAPVLALIALTVSLLLVGDALRKTLDPLRRARSEPVREDIL
ncbi:ABC transporter permease [Lutibaculum baratangense]|uniref:Putative oligopeptide ABC transporter, permease component n=1 Tax=Lutibaculum baratangense AMV1 TaxID=631454 RepID=V4RFJ8_9HYPH|nr:ABC transporter permease [Lutibaculum baratangense]ESR24916.1 putative oligopeptide ABC transporter, permease component [Lutibaculum baratangense AMV1]